MDAYTLSWCLQIPPVTGSRRGKDPNTMGIGQRRLSHTALTPQPAAVDLEIGLLIKEILILLTLFTATLRPRLVWFVPVSGSKVGSA